jgi:predicted methyltransferase
MKNTILNGFHLFSILCVSFVALTAQAERDVSRDQFRHPIATIEFFGLTAEMDVIEITPGGGWYTEILADYVKGTLFAAHFNPASKAAYYLNSLKAFEEKIAANPALYGNVEMHIFDASANLLTTADNSADALVTFRNVHNWLRSGNEAKAFELFYKTLKPGGVFGVVEHRAVPGTARAVMLSSGYMTRRALCWRLALRSMPTQMIAQIIPKAFGLCLRISDWASRTAQNTWPLVRVIA